MYYTASTSTPPAKTSDVMHDHSLLNNMEARSHRVTAVIIRRRQSQNTQLTTRAGNEGPQRFHNHGEGHY